MRTLILLFTFGLATVASAAAPGPPVAVQPETPYPVIEQGSPGVDGSSPDALLVTAGNYTQIVLFHGAAPRHGFLVQVANVYSCSLWVDDTAGATSNAPLPSSSGIEFAQANYQAVGGGIYESFITPAGYRPMGPIYLTIGQCGGGGANLAAYVAFAARAW